MKKKIYVVGDAQHYASFIENYELVSRIEDATHIIFTGGEDVDPSLYGEKKFHRTYSNFKRDITEQNIFNKISPSQIVIGICRGSQFLCVMNGGKLIQDLEGHALYGTHPIIDLETKECYEITSTHHQMQYPYRLPKNNYKVLMASSNLGSWFQGLELSEKEYLQLVQQEPEVVLYTCPDKPKCLAIQGHPEMMNYNAPIITKLNEIINSL
jgi:gamma-glutamyl-gamma-aminobutyrate hydrolase PuuD